MTEGRMEGGTEGQTAGQSTLNLYPSTFGGGKKGKLRVKVLEYCTAS